MDENQFNKDPQQQGFQQDPYQQQPNQFQQNPYQQDPYQQPSPFQQQPMYSGQEQKGTAIASLVLGILSIVCCGIPLFSILGIVFSIQAKKKCPSAQGMATAGMILSIIGLVIFAITMILSFTGNIVLSDILNNYNY